MGQPPEATSATARAVPGSVLYAALDMPAGAADAPGEQRPLGNRFSERRLPLIALTLTSAVVLAATAATPALLHSLIQVHLGGGPGPAGAVGLGATGSASVGPVLRQLSEHCNPSATPLQPTSPVRAFDLPSSWQESCQELPHPPKLPTWEGKDWCWEWTKHVGCYRENGSLSWRDGQTHAARMGLAPFPEKVLMLPVQNPDQCLKYYLGSKLHAAAHHVEAAQSWFTATVAVYVVNLSEDAERLQSISARLKQLGIAFERIEGVDLSSPNGYKQAKDQGLVPNSYDLSLAQANARLPFQGMGGINGSAGCAAAHLKAMQTAVDINAKPLALILEDDVVLADDFILKVRGLLEAEAPCDWAAISLKSRCPYGTCISPHLTRVFPDGNTPAARCHHGVNLGFSAVLYKVSSLGALTARLSQAVWDEERPLCLDVDAAMASISDEVAYYAVPAVQMPGFLMEGRGASSKKARNEGGSKGASVAAPGATAVAPTTVPAAGAPAAIPFATTTQAPTKVVTMPAVTSAVPTLPQASQWQSAAVTTAFPATTAPAATTPVTTAPATAAPATAAPATAAPATTAPATAKTSSEGEKSLAEEQEAAEAAAALPAVAADQKEDTTEAPPSLQPIPRAGPTPPPPPDWGNDVESVEEDYYSPATEAPVPTPAPTPAPQSDGPPPPPPRWSAEEQQEDLFED
mmetsp:Transcript_22877/g.51427  ORF Transcript_22877/g.51427 Transcript_22877/m.51427 type:complete len:691 (+) Transcript_22877:82-2154(+)